MTNLERYEVVFSFHGDAGFNGELIANRLVQSIRQSEVPVGTPETWSDYGWCWQCYPTDTRRNIVEVALASFGDNRWLLAVSYKRSITSFWKCRDHSHIDAVTDALANAFRSVKYQHVKWFYDKPAFADYESGVSSPRYAKASRA